MTMVSAKAIEAAKAVNSLMRLSSSDQESRVAIVEDYFTSPYDDSASDSFADSDSELENNELGQYTIVHV